MRLALLLLAALLTTGTAAAQGTPVACNPFTGFPLIIQLGSRIGNVIVGSENVLCANTKIQTAINTLANQRGVPNGIATLDSTGVLPLAQVPSTILGLPALVDASDGIATLGLDGTLMPAQAPPGIAANTAALAALNAKLGAVNGIATLGSDGRVPLSQIPTLASTATATGAAAAVGAYEVVYPVSGGSGFAPASSSDKTQAGRIVGFANTAAASGAQVTFVVAGPVDNSAWTFAVGPVWLGTAGALVQTAPSTGFAQVIGLAVSPTRVIVQPQTPTILTN